ncbi:tyrosine recombinase XerC [bacterium]|nr:tyrosine recombinase XerC [bacterium]
MSEYIEQFLNYLKIQRRLSTHTLRAYKTDLAQFEESLKGKELLAITTLDVRNFVHKLHNQKMDPTSVSRHLSAIRSLFKYLIGEKIVDKNPAKEVSNPKTPTKMPSYLTEDVMEHFLNTPDTENLSGARDKAILELLYATGLRVSELVSINKEQIDYENKSIIVKGKGKKERLVLFGSYAQDAIKKYLVFRTELESIEGADIDALFLSLRGTRLTQRSVQRIVDKYIELAGIKYKISPHSLRHSFATHMMNNGADIRSIQEFLGHESISTTQRYTHISDKQMFENYDKFHPHK